MEIPAGYFVGFLRVILLIALALAALLILGVRSVSLVQVHMFRSAHYESVSPLPSRLHLRPRSEAEGIISAVNFPV